MRKGQREDLTGKRFGRLVVIAEDHLENRQYYWLCKCDCGNLTVKSGNEMKWGKVKSCGCLRAECKPPLMQTHGMSRSKLYRIWTAMKQRCENEHDPNYFRYGGRGIAVCDEWKAFEPFEKWALSNGYVEGKYDLDRTDNDKGYCPENCRFISHKDNLRNTHRKIEVELDGEIIPLAEAAERYNQPYNRVYMRYERGWRGEDLVKNRL